MPNVGRQRCARLPEGWEVHVWGDANLVSKRVFNRFHYCVWLRRRGVGAENNVPLYKVRAVGCGAARGWILSSDEHLPGRKLKPQPKPRHGFADESFRDSAIFPSETIINNLNQGRLARCRTASDDICSARI